MSDWYARWNLFLKMAAPFHPYVTIEDFMNITHISLKNNFFYAHTPKAGCSTIKKVLIDAEYGEPSNTKQLEYIHFSEFGPLLNIRQVGSIEAFFNRPDIFKFCFVRNPYTRLLSAYLDKMGRFTGEKQSMQIQLGLGNVEEQDFSFQQFVKAVCQTPVQHMNQHWRTQYYQTFQSNIDYDFIGRFEQFEIDLKKVLDRLNISFEKYYQPQRSHATQANKKIKQYYTLELADMVYEKFKIDFEYFDYPRLLPDDPA